MKRLEQVEEESAHVGLSNPSHPMRSTPFSPYREIDRPESDCFSADDLSLSLVRNKKRSYSPLIVSSY